MLVNLLNNAMRYAPGKPLDSMLYLVMKSRGKDQMPPAASGTPTVTSQQLQSVEAWLTSLAPAADGGSDEPGTDDDGGGGTDEPGDDGGGTDEPGTDDGGGTDEPGINDGGGTAEPGT